MKKIISVLMVAVCLMMAALLRLSCTLGKKVV